MSGIKYYTLSKDEELPDEFCAVRSVGGEPSEYTFYAPNETCEMECVSDFMSWHCKACDMMDMAPRNPKPRYCKWCGRKVVDG